MIGQGLQHLLTSPMAGGQEQFPDPTDLVGQVMGQFEEYLRKRGAGASMGGGQGLQQPAQQSIQAPVGTPPRERAGQLRAATGEGATTYMQQAGEAAAEPWKPKALDIGLMAATIALPIIAAMQPEGKGRRGQRKQQRMSNLFKTLGGFAGKGLEARMGSFAAGKEAALGTAETRAEMSVDEAQAGYERKISGIEAAEGKRRWGAERDLAERRETRLGLPGAEKGLSPSLQYRMGRDAQADARRDQAQGQKDILVQANQIAQTLNLGYDIDSIQDLDNAIYKLERTPSPVALQRGGQWSHMEAMLSELKQMRNQYYGGGRATPEEQADFERLTRKYGTQ